MLVINYVRKLAAGGYAIAGSGQPDGSTGYLSRTFTSSATHSGSVVLKRAKLGATQAIIGTSIYFNSSNQLVCNGLTSTAVFRDPAVWMHIFWNTDGVWVNGTSVSGTGTYATAVLTNPKLGSDGTNYLDGYISLFAFGDGYSWTLASTGALDANGYWNPKNHSALSGVDFIVGQDVATGTATTGNSWTKTGTITATNDSPTDSAVSGYGNHATFDANNTATSIAVSNGGRTVTNSAGDRQAQTTFTFDVEDADGIYAEFTIGALNDSQFAGICTDPSMINAATNIQTDARTYLFRPSNGNKYNTGDTAFAAAVAATGTFAVFAKAGSVYFGSCSGGTTSWGDGVGGFSDSTPDVAAFTGLTGQCTFVWVTATAGARSMTINTGAVAYVGAAPAGAKKLATQDMDAPAYSSPITGSFTGNASTTNAPFINLGCAPDTASTSTIDGSNITWGTHAIALSTGFLITTASSPYNDAATNNYSVAVLASNSGGAIQGATATDAAQGRAR